jgi:hypothetical protein
MQLISDNGISQVYRNGDWVIKKQPKFLTDNEWYALRLLKDTGFVPQAEKVDISTLRIEYVENEPIADPVEFHNNCWIALETLKKHEIRHGDLTRYAVLESTGQNRVIATIQDRTKDAEGMLGGLPKR